MIKVTYHDGTYDEFKDADSFKITFRQSGNLLKIQKEVTYYKKSIFGLHRKRTGFNDIAFINYALVASVVDAK